MARIFKRPGKMAKIFFVLFAVGVLVIASNMGFKLVYQLLASTGTNSGTNWTSIPENFPFANAADWKADITNCTQISRFVRSNDTLQSYTGGKGSVNFPIEPGLAYLIKVSTDTNYVIVGSHDPSYGIPLNTSTGTNSGTNWLSVPYHTTANNASDLQNDIPNCTQVSRFIRSNDTIQTYTGGKGSINFPITPGEGILVKVSTDSTWTPSHY